MNICLPEFLHGRVVESPRISRLLLSIVIGMWLDTARELMKPWIENSIFQQEEQTSGVFGNNEGNCPLVSRRRKRYLIVTRFYSTTSFK